VFEGAGTEGLDDRQVVGPRVTLVKSVSKEGLCQGALSAARRTDNEAELPAGLQRPEGHADLPGGVLDGIEIEHAGHLSHPK
jgi:hypothetical protein